MLSGHANRFSDVYFFIELLVSLSIGQRILYECVEANFLVVHRCKRIVVLCLPQDSHFNQTIQGKWIVGRDNQVPFYVLLHLILQQLCALSKN